MKVNKMSLAALMLSAFLTAGAVSPSMANKVKNPVVKSEEKADVKVQYLGMQKEFLYFDVEIAQPEAQKSTLSIKDADGNDLYSDVISQDKYRKTIKVHKDEVSKLQFVVTTKNETIKKYFDINVAYAIQVSEVAKL